MAHGGKPSISLSTKIALAIIVVVGIAAFFYYDPASLNFGGIPGVSEIGGGLTNIFGGTSSAGERLNFTMTSSESFFGGELDLKETSVTLRGAHSVATSAGDSVFDNLGKDSEVTFDGFNGKMSVKDGKLSISGTATSASSGGADRIRPKSKSFSVSTELVPSSYSISPVTIDKISLVKVFGSIERPGDESSTTQLANSTVQIANFQGSLMFDGESYRISGSATEVKGKSFTLKG